MKRYQTELWFQILAGETEADAAQVAGADENLLATLHADLRMDSLLRANCRDISESDSDRFVANVVKRLTAGNQHRPILSHSARLARRKKSVRIALVATLIAVAAAAAWQVGRTKKVGTSVPTSPRLHGSSLDQTKPTQPIHGHAPLPERGRANGGLRPALVIVGRIPPSPADALVIQRLTTMGLSSTPKLPSQIDLDRDMRVDLVAISASAESSAFEGELARALSVLPVPIVLWEPWLFDDLGMSDCKPPNHGGCGWVVTDGTVELADHGAPVLQTPSTAIAVTNVPAVVSFGTPLPSASVVGTIESVTPLTVLFTYERGAALTHGPAPARRVGLFLSEATAQSLTDEGWSVVEASVRWARGRQSGL